MNSLVVILFGVSFIILLVDVFANPWTFDDNRNISQYYVLVIQHHVEHNKACDDSMHDAKSAISATCTIESLTVLKNVIVEGLGKIKNRIQQGDYIASMDHAIKITEGIAEICKFVNRYQKPEIRTPEIPGRGQLKDIYIVAATYLLTHEGLITPNGNPSPETESKLYLAPVLHILNMYRMAQADAKNIPANEIGDYTNWITDGFENENVCGDKKLPQI